MAAKPKLTQEEWNHVRQAWGSDPRKGFPWLIKELNLPVSVEAIRLRSKQEGWVKGGSSKKPSLENTKTKLGKTEKPSLEKSKKQALKPKKVIPVIADAEWEEVDEKTLKTHGNSKYLPIFDRQAYELCLLGATDEEMSQFFEVSESTLNLWKNHHITFSESIKRGKISADARMAERLFTRGCGYRYSEVKTKQMPDEKGNMMDVEIVTTEKEVPPDTGAAFIWLKNRRPKDWRDKQEIEIKNQLGPELLKRLETEMVARMEASRERQRLVDIERGLVVIGDDDKDDND
jgi:hypothetical protein